MKTTHAIASCALLAALVLAAPMGCGSSESSTTPPPPTDSGNDSGGGDTGKPLDTGTDTKKDTAPPPDTPVCDQDLPSDFKCDPATKTAGSTACTEAALQAYIKACHPPLGGGTTLCAKWKTDYPACAPCTTAWTYKSGAPARDYCYYRIMTPECADTVFCYFSCVTLVCQECSFADTGGTTEHLECEKRNRVTGGRCYDNSYKKATSLNCFESATLDPCIAEDYSKATPDKVALADQLMEFYRGACRDNADWKNAKSPGDAGTDGGTTETGTDAGSSDATDAD